MSPNKEKMAVRCTIEDGKVTSIARYKAEYLKAIRSSKKGLSVNKLLGKGWYNERSLLLDIGFEERDRGPNDEYVIGGVVKKQYFDPAKSTLSKPISFFIVGEKKLRFKCLVRDDIVQNYTFSEVGPLTWTERGKLEQFRFY